ncbi:hypothetical protein ACFE04_018549 [Oxalis oulophora]
MLDDEIGDKQAGGCSRNNAEIDSGSEEENGSDFDEEWLDDVEYGSENENDELNEYLQKAKGFVDESATRGTGEGRSGETGEDDSDKDYSIGMDYEDDEELNWSLSDEDLPNELQELIKESGEVGNTRWRKSKKIYYNPERPNLQLHMIFSDPVQFREALIETSIESGYPFKSCIYKWGGRHGAEVKEGQNTYVVRTLASSCSCRAWDLQGIPCRHAIALMVARNLPVDDYVSPWFKKDLYVELYNNYIPHAMEVGKELWPRSDLEPLEGPPPRIIKGRPRRKRIPEPGIFGGTSTVIASGPSLSNNVQSPTGKSKAKKVVQQVKPWVGKTKRSSSVTIPGTGVFLSPKKKRSSSQRIPNTSVTPPRTSQSESSTPLSFSLWKKRALAKVLDVKSMRVDGMLSTQGSRS